MKCLKNGYKMKERLKVPTHCNTNYQNKALSIDDCLMSIIPSAPTSLMVKSVQCSHWSNHNNYPNLSEIYLILSIDSLDWRKKTKKTQVCLHKLSFFGIECRTKNRLLIERCRSIKKNYIHNKLQTETDNGT